MAKLPGKTVYSGRRRTATRKSGFVSHPDSTGGEYKQVYAQKYLLRKDNPLTITFQFPIPEKEIFAGFGGYFKCNQNVVVRITNPNTGKNLLNYFVPPDWSKFGSIWKVNEAQKPVSISFSSHFDTELALYQLSCGLIWHEYFNDARSNIMKGMHNFAPEGNFYIKSGNILFSDKKLMEVSEKEVIHLKSCNRCARYLPINIENERNHLSFTNHCVAKAPCQHRGFGILKNVTDASEIHLYFGFQLECRFCKRYVVNAALNPQRSAAQMKEDGQRRRNFELLLAELYQMSPQLAYRHKTGRELTDDVWEKFNKKCFKCGVRLQNAREMNLDHTRPLALLWPLDETATALCSTCNSSKRDRYPSAFYDKNELRQLADIAGLSLEELENPAPNHEAIKKLIENEAWFFDEFLVKPELLKERDGKITAELVVKALDKVLERSDVFYDYSFIDEYNKRRDGK